MAFPLAAMLFGCPEDYLGGVEISGHLTFSRFCCCPLVQGSIAALILFESATIRAGCSPLPLYLYYGASFLPGFEYTFTFAF